MKKTIKIPLLVLACLAGLAVLAVGAFNIYFRLSVPDFYKRACAEDRIPGLADGFIPQGLSRVPKEDVFLACGYMKDGSASRIYLYHDAEPRYAALMDPSGGEDATHAGGLSYWNGYIFLTHENEIAVYNWEDVKAVAAGSDGVAPAARFSVGFGAAFCHVEGDSLYVGEFYRNEVYPTPENHHMTTDSGDLHHALLCVYDLAQLEADGFSEARPLRAYSILDQAQGVCLTGSGSLCISTSWGVSFSHIRVYDDPASGPADREIVIGDSTVPLYYLDAAHALEDIPLVPMCEELYYMDGRLYFINESASAKYIFGKLTGGGRIFSLAVAD